MSDILREIDEEVAKEKSEQFLEKWGLSIGIFILILVAGLFFYFNWQTRAEETALDEADSFARAVETLTTDPETSTALLTDLGKSNSGFQELATFKIGDTLWTQGNHQDAIAAWQAYADDATHNANLINTTRFKLAWFGNGLLEPNEITFHIETLEDLTAYAPYTPVLRALVALEADDKQTALSLLNQILDDENAPELTQNLASTLERLVNTL